MEILEETPVETPVEIPEESAEIQAEIQAKIPMQIQDQIYLLFALENKMRNSLCDSNEIYRISCLLANMCCALTVSEDWVQIGVCTKSYSVLHHYYRNRSMEMHEFSKCADDIINHYVIHENPPDKDEWCRHLVQEQKILQEKIMNEYRESEEKEDM
jgi:hypothetical protein